MSDDHGKKAAEAEAHLKAWQKREEARIQRLKDQAKQHGPPPEHLKRVPATVHYQLNSITLCGISIRQLQPGHLWYRVPPTADLPDPSRVNCATCLAARPGFQKAAEIKPKK